MDCRLLLLPLVTALLCGAVAQGGMPTAPWAQTAGTPCAGKGGDGPAVFADAEGSFTIGLGGHNLNGYHVTLISLSPSGSHAATYHSRIERTEDSGYLTFYRIGVAGEPGVIALLDAAWYPDTESFDDEQLKEAIARSRYAFFIPGPKPPVAE